MLSCSIANLVLSRLNRAISSIWATFIFLMVMVAMVVVVEATIESISALAHCGPVLALITPATTTTTRVRERERQSHNEDGSGADFL